MRVMKFGGSSVADADRIRAVGEIVCQAAQEGPVALVFSAMKGVTNSLLEAADLAQDGQGAYRDILRDLRSRHEQVVRELVPPGDTGGTADLVENLLEELSELLHGVSLVRECSPRTRDLVVSFGERLSCPVIAAYLTSRGTPAEWVDAREMIVTDENHGSALVKSSRTSQAIAGRLHGVTGIPVITGFIAATPQGVTTTLGRNGSDYTAALVGAAMAASAVEIWTDVDGVMSADPRYVEKAFVIPDLSLQEAMELSYFGAEVIHPYTMIPSVERHIPLWIKNTLNPGARGTRITRESPETDHTITGIASIENVALINVQGGGMLGIPGIASRVFGALARAEVNVIMISQASSEHSICLCVRETELHRACEFLRQELRPELESRRIEQFEEQPSLEIIAVIGAMMRGHPGIAGKLFSALGDSGLNVLAIAQGSSEMNISFVINREDRKAALNVVHDAFFSE
ncbi:aspartate kinase [Alkalispirochaeta sphaeroplastigenens]|uniref:Aspartokinase n=1 Tax=Alkalispirochaeta sphaeroplastigenens TaxID=1187066 RepID=A0A2S4JHP1_9SPIO|nr:aspartate kinase [Alkalispirochaeta sphaeroplastigenens]POQ99021.1 aspartate kinase [Alkalispirochaeta sphaeroplastigenens]